MKKARLCLLLLLISLPARAQVEQHPKDITKSGKIFLEACSYVDKQSNQMNSFETHTVVQCLSYIDGVFETMSLIDNLKLKPRGFCAPKQPVERKQLVRIVRKYITDHPETSSERTVALVWVALSQAFPCFESST
jgi:Rap1a immunity proteins